ncbi:DUF2339 domain-containing protein [Metallumcola ferriviriculae]|uniref:DUF2339 domain-containing protein n=1 Tax=Metallumcola ferriviriculae TaxID=3039180 RepID=A0AAU0UMH9_9FIRM|nr:DUF2339 domain-containing protein [Desulfitibacteraceae bacterium MK1]
MENEIKVLQEQVTELSRTVEDLQSRLELIEDRKKANLALGTKPEPRPLAEKTIGTLKEKRKELQTKAKRPRVNLELRLGQMLNRLGVVALIVGLAIFLKYSFDNQWIGPTGRIILGMLLGVGLWAGGEYTKKKYPRYAQGLLGGGSLAMFFSIYAGYSFYDLFSQVATFIVLVVIMALTVVMAVRHDAMVIGVLGIIGGYLTPFMVGSNDPNPWVLFTYLTILTAGVLGVSSSRKWILFNYLSFFFNQAIILFWMFAEFDLGYLTPTMLFLVVTFVLYVGITTAYNIRQRKLSTTAETILMGLNAFLFFAWSATALEGTIIDGYMGFYAIFLACCYIYLGRTVYTVYKDDKKQLFVLFGTALVLITIAMPLQLKEHYLSIAWLTEALSVIFISFKLSSKKLRFGGLIILAIALMSTWEFVDSWWMNKEMFLLNYRTLVGLYAIVVTGLVAWLYAQNAGEDEKPLAFILQGVVLMEVFIFLTMQNSHFFSMKDYDFLLSPEQLSLSGIWMLYAIVLFTLGLKKNNRYLRFGGLGLIGIVIAKAFFVDLDDLATIYKIVLFIILGLCLLGVSFVYQKKKDIIIGEDSEEEM